MTSLEKDLEELERTDPAVRDAARSWESLRQRVQDGSLDIAASVWGEPTKRGSFNFQYRDSHLDICWVTNVPNTLDEALEYFHQLVLWGLKPCYIEMQDATGPDGWKNPYELQTYEFNPETGELVDLAKEG